jgi:hypothetical protein
MKQHRRLFLLVLSVLAAFSLGAEGKRYAILVGINEYLDPSFAKLSTPRNDANDLALCLLQAGWDKTFVMSDAADARSPDFPTRGNLIRRMTLLAELADPADTVMLFFSGHGLSDGGGDYFLPVDADSLKLKESSISLAAETGIFLDKNIDKTIVVVDACRETVMTTKGIQIVGVGGGRVIPSETSRTSSMLYATKAGWYSYEDPLGRNGVFTKFLINGLQGAAAGAFSGAGAGRDALVTLADLSVWLPDAVAAYSLDSGIRQKPVVSLNRSGAGALVLGKTVSAQTVVRSERSPSVSVDSKAVRGLGPVIIDEMEMLSRKINLTVFMRMHKPFFESTPQDWKDNPDLAGLGAGLEAVVTRHDLELKSSSDESVRAGFGIFDHAVFGDSIIQWSVKNGSSAQEWQLCARRDDGTGQQLRFSFTANGQFKFESMIGGDIIVHTIHVGRPREFDAGSYNDYILALKGNVYFLLVNDKPFCLIESRESSIAAGRYGFTFSSSKPGSLFVKDISVWDY